MPQDYFVTQGTSVSVPAGGTAEVTVGTICGSTIDMPPAPSRTEATQQGVSLPQYDVGLAPPASAAFIETAINLARNGKLSGGGLISDEEFIQAVVEVGAGWGPAAERAGKTFTKDDFIKHIEQRVIASGGKQNRQDMENLATAVFDGVDVTSKAAAGHRPQILSMKPTAREIMELEEALREDLRATLKENAAGVSSETLDTLENDVMSRASMVMCQRSSDPMLSRSKDVINIEEALRKDLNATLKEGLAGLETEKLEKLEKSIMSRASMQMCQRTIDA